VLVCFVFSEWAWNLKLNLSCIINPPDGWHLVVRGPSTQWSRCLWWWSYACRLARGGGMLLLAASALHVNVTRGLMITLFQWVQELSSLFVGLVLQEIGTWRWALLEKPRVVALLKNFPTFYGTWRLTISGLSWRIIVISSHTWG
jgi:hypothetical protein